MANGLRLGEGLWGVLQDAPCWRLKGTGRRRAEDCDEWAYGSSERRKYGPNAGQREGPAERTPVEIRVAVAIDVVAGALLGAHTRAGVGMGLGEMVWAWSYCVREQNKPHDQSPR
jgi:hypothetical protein